MALPTSFQQLSSPEHQKGQILLVIVLVMIVALSIGLSVVTRSITNLQVSTEEENSQRALSAAEAGIERALELGEGDIQDELLGNNSQIEEVSFDDLSGNQFLVNNGNLVLKDDGADIWLSNYEADENNAKYEITYDGDIRILWGAPGDSCGANMNNTSALELLLVYKHTDTFAAQIRNFPIDPCGTTRPPQNNFFCRIGPVVMDGTALRCPATEQRTTAPYYSIGGKQFRYSTRIPIQKGVMIRAVPLYAPTAIGVQAVDPDNPLPSQGSVIESLGASGRTQRKLSVYRGFAKVPVEFFPYVLFSP